MPWLLPDTWSGYTYARVPALPRLVSACPLCWCRASGGRIARGAPTASVYTMAHPEVPRDVNDLLIEEEVEDDAVIARTPADRFLASLSEHDKENVTVRVSAASPLGALSSL